LTNKDEWYWDTEEIILNPDSTFIFSNYGSCVVQSDIATGKWYVSKDTIRFKSNANISPNCICRQDKLKNDSSITFFDSRIKTDSSLAIAFMYILVHDSLKNETVAIQSDKNGKYNPGNLKNIDYIELVDIGFKTCRISRNELNKLPLKVFMQNYYQSINIDNYKFLIVKKSRLKLIGSPEEQTIYYSRMK
jgi:hypothetical protein